MLKLIDESKKKICNIKIVYKMKNTTFKLNNISNFIEHGLLLEKIEKMQSYVLNNLHIPAILICIYIFLLYFF